MHTSYRLIVTIMILMGSCLNAHAAPQFLKVSDKQTVELSQLIADTKDSDVLFIGETHDDKKQHDNQLDIIRALYARKTPVALGIEMFASDNQQQLDDWIGGKVDEKDFRLIYARNWSYDWTLYREIFKFARDNHIPMIALNIPKPIIAKVVAQGASALSDNDKKVIPRRTSWALNPPKTEYLKRIYMQVFGNKPVRIPFANFCEAQALRNNGMAWSIAKYKDKYPKSQIIVIAGTWHAIKNGVPEQLKEYGNLGYKVVLPELREFDLQNATPDTADYFMVK